MPCRHTLTKEHPMSKIDLYIAHSLDREATCLELAQTLTAQLDSLDQYDTVNRGRVETARAIIGDPQRRQVYDALLADAASHVDEPVLASIATGAPSAPSAPTPPPAGWPPAPPQQAPQHPSPQFGAVERPRSAQPPAQPMTQLPMTRVIVVPDGIIPKVDYWADSWTLEVSGDGTSLRLVGTGKGTQARKAATKDEGGWFAYTLGAVIGLS